MSVAEMRAAFKDNKKFLRFINDMLRANREVRWYGPRGGGGKEYPGVVCEAHELVTVIQATRVKVEHDTLGKGYIVYVR